MSLTVLCSKECWVRVLLKGSEFRQIGRSNEELLCP
jgi:hypothetical protein